MEGFRPNLAKTLKETPKEERRAILDEAQNTEEYRVTEKVHKTRKELLKKYSDVDSEKENIELDESMEKLGFDIVDISEKIPKEIDLLIEKSKIGEKISDEEKEKIQDFYNFLTDGKYYDLKYLNHSIGGYDSIEDRKDRLSRKFLNKRHSFSTQIQHSRDSGFFFAVGKNEWVSPDKPLAIFSNENQNFSYFLLSEILKYEDRYLNYENLKSIVDEHMIYSENSMKINLDQIIEILRHDETLQNLVSKKAKIVERDGNKLHHIDDMGYHAEESSVVTAFLALNNENIEFSANAEGVVINGGEGSMYGDYLIDEISQGNGYSFSKLADTIVDLLGKRIYKFNKEKLVKE